MSIFYNNFSFDPLSSNLTASASFRYDDSDRIIVAVVWRFRVRAIIMPLYDSSLGMGSASAAQRMELIRRRLTEQGKQLTISDYGFGPKLTINPAAGYAADAGEVVTYDIKYGPKPRILEWTPIGSSNASEIVWEIETQMSPCGTQLASEYSGLSALAFALTFSHVARGYTTRTLRGYVEIATTTNNGLATDSADDYRGSLTITPFANGHREQTYDLSMDHTRLDVTIIDREIPSPRAFPAGVTNIEANNRFVTRLPSSRVSNEITATIELAQDQPRTRAWVIFAAIVDDTRAALDNAGTPIQYLNRSLAVDESIFANRISFTLRWETFCSLEEFITSNMMFQELVQFNWNDWHASMTDVQSRRGLADARFIYSQDKLVNLCDPNNVALTTGATPTVPPPSQIDTLRNSLPTPGKSWMYIDPYLKKRTKYRLIPHKSQGAPSVTRTAFDINNPNGTLATINPSGYTRHYSEAPATEYWEWKGIAVRAGYPIPEPDKLTIDGKTLRPVGEHHFLMQKIGEVFSLPVYAAAWNMLYVADETPDGSAAQDETKPVPK